MIVLCKHGHEQTPENQYKVNDKQRGVRYRCKPCNAASRDRKGTPSRANTLSLLNRNRVEDVEFLLHHGGQGKELVERSGYARAWNLRSGLITAGRTDLLERI